MKQLNLGEETREVDIVVTLRINSKLDKTELEFIRKRIKESILTQRNSCGFEVLGITKIPFEPFKMKMGIAEVLCKGDKLKTTDEILKHQKEG